MGGQLGVTAINVVRHAVPYLLHGRLSPLQTMLHTSAHVVVNATAMAGLVVCWVHRAILHGKLQAHFVAAVCPWQEPLSSERERERERVLSRTSLSQKATIAPAPVAAARATAAAVTKEVPANAAHEP